MTAFVMTRDITGQNGFGLSFSNFNFNTALTQNVEQNFTVPIDYKLWIAIFTFTPGTTIYATINGTASEPGTSFAISSSQMNPAGRKVKSGDIISVISGDVGCRVCVQLYGIPV